MILILLVFSAAAARFIPHIPNAAPITALAIVAATFLPARKALGLTFLARLISDLFLGFFSLPLMVAVYGSHLVAVLFGSWIKNSPTHGWLKIVAAAAGSAVLFFLVTNFAFLYSTYPHNLSGIMASYLNGLPFLRGTMLGDVGYTVALFGSVEALKYFLNIKNNKRIAHA